VIRRNARIRLTETDRDMMRAAGRFNAQLLDVVRPHVKPGVETRELDKIIHEFTLDHGHVPACLGYGGEAGAFPKSCCISVNDVICHGIPDAYELKPGDIANVDLTTIVDGWHGDQSETFLIGDDSDISEEALDYVQRNYGFGIVDKYVGHGIGTKFHQRPNVPHVPSAQSHRDRLHPGMCFTIEPMINGGTARSIIDQRDGWTVRTRDGRLSAQFEHTILMTEDGPEILTTTQNGPQPGFQF